MAVQTGRITAASVTGVAWWLGGNTSYGNRVRLASVTDGTSNTAAFSEWVKGKSGQNSPGLNLVYCDRPIHQRRTAERRQHVHGFQDPALGFQG